jgi:hypothetical protein
VVAKIVTGNENPSIVTPIEADPAAWFFDTVHCRMAKTD